MIDHAAHVESVVRDELARQALANGIDKALVGFAVAPVGPCPVQTESGPAMVPSWIMTITLRTELVGMPPLPAPILIPGALPGDDDFRGAVRASLEGCIKARDEVMRGGQ